MPDCAKSTPPLPISQTQEALASIVADLRLLDERLLALAQGIELDPVAALPADLRAGVECVRTDLLSDAIATLSGLASLTEDAALERRGAVVAAVKYLGGITAELYAIG